MDNFSLSCVNGYGRMEEILSVRLFYENKFTHNNRGIVMKKHYVFLYSLVTVVLIIISISLANAVGGNGYYIFYNLIYGILLSTILPLMITYKNSETIQSLGFKELD